MSATYKSGPRTALGFALLLAAFLALGAYCIPHWAEYRLEPGTIVHRGGNAYTANVASLLPRGIASRLVVAAVDSPDRPSASKLLLLEQGAPIGPPHATHASIAAQGRGAFSHWGDALVFSASDNSDPRTNGRAYLVRLPVAPAWWVVWVLGLAAVAALGPRRALGHVSTHPGLVFWSGAAALAIGLNLVFALLLAAPVVSPDSNTYLTWSLFRPIGYPVLLFSYHFMVRSWEYLPLYQLELLLAGAFLLAYAVARSCGSYRIGWLLLCVAVGTTTMMASAADLLTEAPFAAFTMLHVGAMILAFVKGQRPVALLAGLSLASAIAIKSVGLVLLAPVVLVALAVPARRHVLLALVALPAALAWLAPSAYNYARHGTFESSHAGGFALAGHVAWAIHPADRGIGEEEAALVERSVAPVLARRPAAFGSVLHYVSYTSDEYNELLWGNMVPAMEKHYANRPPEPCDWAGRGRGCIVPHTLSVNRALVRLARQAIVQEPRAYAEHVAAHYYGMWRDVMSPAGDLLRAINYRADSLHAGYDPAASGYAAMLAPLPPMKPPAQRWEVVMRLEASPPWRLLDLLTLRDGVQLFGARVAYGMPYVLFAIAVAASMLVFRLGRLSPAAQALCYCALCTNAYFLGTALAQPSLVRYAAVMQGVVAAMLLLALRVAWRAVYDPVSRRASAGIPPSWRRS